MIGQIKILKWFFIFLFLANSSISIGQKAINDILINISTPTSTSDSLSIDKLKFYLSNFNLLKEGEIVWIEKESYHLIDISKPKSQFFTFNLSERIEFDEIQFLLGTDSLVNTAGVMSGDLDPTKGMYWAWNSGYINFKIEGTNSLFPFEFHLGGYAPPFQTVQKIKLETTNSNNLTIELNITEFLNQIDLTKTYKIMSPGKEAQRLSILLSTLFSINE